MTTSSTDRIEKQVEIKAPVSRVWKALTDHQQFGEWFQVKLESPFVAGQRTRGRITYPGYEHILMEVLVEAVEPERYFSYRWHPGAADWGLDFERETPTLVEFFLERSDAGTILKVIESGFDAVPAARRAEAFRMNTEGWAEQMGNIHKYVTRTG